MRIFLNKALISCYLVLLLQNYAIAHNPNFCDDAKRITTNFIRSGTNNDWDTIEAKAYGLKKCTCEMAPIFYYIYRMKTLLPNSQALQGVSPNDFIAAQKFQMYKQVQILSNCDKKAYFPFINAMIKQNFDSEIADSASELKQMIYSSKP